MTHSGSKGEAYRYRLNTAVLFLSVLLFLKIYVTIEQFICFYAWSHLDSDIQKTDIGYMFESG